MGCLHCCAGRKMKKDLVVCAFRSFDPLVSWQLGILCLPELLSKDRRLSETQDRACILCRTHPSPGQQLQPLLYQQQNCIAQSNFISVPQNFLLEIKLQLYGLSLLYSFLHFQTCFQPAHHFILFLLAFHHLGFLHRRAVGSGQQIYQLNS